MKQNLLKTPDFNNLLAGANPSGSGHTNAMGPLGLQNKRTEGSRLWNLNKNLYHGHGSGVDQNSNSTREEV